MTRAEIHARLVAAEEGRGLLEHRIGRWSVWPILRKVVADRLSGDFRYAAAKPTKTQRHWTQVLHDAMSLRKLRRARVLIKTYSSGLLETTGDGKLRDVWFDDVVRGCGDAFKFEGINNPSFVNARAHALVPSDATTTLLDITARALTRTARWLPEISAVSRRLADAIESEFGPILPEPTIRVTLANFLWQQKLWRKVLRRVRPEKVLLADFGEYGLVAAAREMAIPVFELQHGVADRHHPAYAWSDYAVPYGRNIPSADRFLIYGEYWQRELSYSEFWRGRLDVVGSTRIDRHRAMPRTSGRGPLRLLVAADGIDSTGTIRIVRELLASDVKSEAEVIVKLHPVYTALDDEIRSALAGQARVKVEGAEQGQSTLRILRSVDLHASIASASHYDALGLGTPTVIIGAGNYRTILRLHQEGTAGLVFNGEELRGSLETARRAPLTSDVSSDFFKPGALENILAAIGERTQSRSKPSL